MPQLEFHHTRLTLSPFEDRDFDAVVFSANGVDYIRTDEGRAKCLAKVARVLKPGGVFVASSHNARAIGVWPQLKTAHGMQIPWRIIYSIHASARLAARSLSHAAFRNGSGYVFDPLHGGLTTYTSTPRTFASQTEAAGLEVVDVVGGRYPDVQALSLMPWHHYACRKS
jgi:SAM-dependent methyltransferase